MQPAVAALPPPTLPAFVAGAPQPNAYAVVIGIEHYDSLPAPTGAKADAERFAELAKRSLGVPADHVHLVVDARATKGAVERELDRGASLENDGDARVHGAHCVSPGALSPPRSARRARPASRPNPGRRR